MKEPLNSIAEITAKANDIFCDQHTQIGTIIGIIDKMLRKQGMNSDAVTIDCPSLDKKIVFMMHDEKPETIDLAFGNKAGDVFSSETIALSTLTTEKIVEIMTEQFL